MMPEQRDHIIQLLQNGEEGRENIRLVEAAQELSRNGDAETKRTAEAYLKDLTVKDRWGLKSGLKTPQ